MLKAPAPVAGEIVHEAGLTPLLAESKLATAVIRSVLPAPTEGLAADSATVIAGRRIVMLAEADLDASATEVAVRVTEVLLGMVAGGVKVLTALSEVLLVDKEPHAGEQGAPPCVRVQLRPEPAGSF